MLAIYIESCSSIGSFQHCFGGLGPVEQFEPVVASLGLWHRLKQSLLF